MNDEYLWNKSGEDAEIQRIESTLKVFRSDGNHIPVFSTDSQVAKPEAARAHGFFSSYRVFSHWRLALSFSSALIVVVSLFWLRGGFAEKSTDRAADGISVKEPSVLVINGPDLPTNAAIPVEEKLLYRTPQKLPVESTGYSRPRRTVVPVRVRKTTVKKPSPVITKLTDEERFAYKQLMTALSITGSKLKIVRDAVSGERSEVSASKGSR